MTITLPTANIKRVKSDTPYCSVNSFRQRIYRYYSFPFL